jgi:phosphomannomutase
MKPLKIGITGVRGIVGETFTPELAVEFSQAFGTYLDGGRILVCRDTRPSGPMVQAAVMSGLLAAGCDVIDLGVCPTPSLQLAITWLKADGGIAITAGHNPSQWNALKFVRNDGLYLNSIQGEELLDIFHQGEFTKATSDRMKSAVVKQDAINHHIERLKEDI